MFYRFPFRTIGADLYAKEFQEHRRLLYDRQASGYVNVDELLRQSEEAGLIPRGSLEASIYYGDD